MAERGKREVSVKPARLLSEISQGKEERIDAERRGLLDKEQKKSGTRSSKVLNRNPATVARE